MTRSIPVGSSLCKLRAKYSSAPQRSTSGNDRAQFSAKGALVFRRLQRPSLRRLAPCQFDAPNDVDGRGSRLLESTRSEGHDTRNSQRVLRERPNINHFPPSPHEHERFRQQRKASDDEGLLDTKVLSTGCFRTSTCARSDVYPLTVA